MAGTTSPSPRRPAPKCTWYRSSKGWLLTLCVCVCVCVRARACVCMCVRESEAALVNPLALSDCVRLPHMCTCVVGKVVY